MAESSQQATKQQKIDELMAGLGQQLSSLSVEEIDCLHSRCDKLVQEFGALASKLGAPESAAPPLSPVVPDLIVLFGYEAPRIIADGEVVNGLTMLERAKEANAVSGKAECEDFLAHANANESEILAGLRGKVVFVFAGWWHPNGFERVAIVYWDGGRWIQYWGWLCYSWDERRRPVRRSTKLQ